MKWLLLLCVAVLLAACASVEEVKDAQGQGAKRTFRHPYEAVYQATANAVAKRKLEVIEQDRATGRFVLSNGGSRSSFGERIAVFLTRLNERTTSVEVVSKSVGGVLSFPPNWPALLFGDIDQELTVRRPK